MTEDQLKEYAAICEAAANGNPLASEFISRWLEYTSHVAGLIATGNRNPSDFLDVLAETVMVYSCAYYSQHAQQLTLGAAQMFNDFAEGKTDAANRMILQVAAMEGGFGLMRAVSQRLVAMVDKPSPTS